MASPDLADSWLSPPGESLNGSFNIHTNEAIPDNVLPVLDSSTSSPSYNRNIPKPPPLPVKTSSRINNSPRFAECCIVPKETKDTWDKIFKNGYGADVLILTEDEAIIPAHSTVLSIASSVLGNFLQQAKVKNAITYIKIPGIPYEAVRMFIRFLYSSCFEEEEMKKFVLHLLVLSHSYSIPALKRVCIRFLDQGLLTIDNVIDVIQLARNCDAPQLTLICLRKIIKDFKTVSSTEGWKVMKRANPALEQELLESVVEADTRKQDKLNKSEERKIYLQLYEAMEALLHICRDGCRTIGPHDKILRVSEASCPFPACKGVESLVRHFSNCKMRVPVGCVHCKRMWQLLELHSRMCNDSDSCRVPLCRHFKGKMQYQSKKDEAKWKLLVSKVTKARNALGPFVASRSRLL